MGSSEADACPLAGELSISGKADGRASARRRHTRWLSGGVGSFGASMVVVFKRLNA